MNKRFYVDGDIVINTPYFACPYMGAGFGIPEGADIIKTNEVHNGRPCLVIDDDRPQSIFYEYYATGEVSTGYVCPSYLCNDYEDCFDIYKEQIDSIKETLSELTVLTKSSSKMLCKSLYISSITALDSFLCSIILVKILADENVFKKYYEKQFPSHTQKKLQRYLLDDDRAKWEQQCIVEVLKGSYCNVATIKDVFKLFGWPHSSADSLSQFFHCRHLLVHRSGIKRDGSQIEIDSCTISQQIEELNAFVTNLMDSILKIEY